MPDIRINEFTDPGCPWAWSAEPFRRRIEWLYGDRVEWRIHLVGLSETPEDYLEKGFTPEKMAAAFAQIAHEHGMPIATHERPRMAATMPACCAVVAVREHVSERAAWALLRRLRIAHFSGALLDEPETIAEAAHAVGLDPDTVASWCRDPDVEAALRVDMAAARQPIPAARVLDDKLANWSGGLRYTCPSYEIVRLSDGVKIAVPGFQPFAVYDVVLANLIPDLPRRDDPETVEEVLGWAGDPLATQEVAVLLDCTLEEAREELGRAAVETHLGFDGLWTLPRYSKLSIAASSSDAPATTRSASASSSA